MIFLFKGILIFSSIIWVCNTFFGIYFGSIVWQFHSINYLIQQMTKHLNFKFVSKRINKNHHEICWRYCHERKASMLLNENCSSLLHDKNLWIHLCLRLLFIMRKTEIWSEYICNVLPLKTNDRTGKVPEEGLTVWSIAKWAEVGNIGWSRCTISIKIAKTVKMFLSL